MKTKKPRTLRIGYDPEQVGVPTSITVHGDGRIWLVGDKGSLAIDTVSTGLSYDRPKGPKVTVELFSIPGGPASVPAALARFTQIFGADTNTREIRGEKVSVTGIFEILDYHLEDSSWHCRFSPIGAIEVRGATVDAERLGWHEALAHLTHIGRLRDRALFIVDAHLGDLPRVARREEPVFADAVLPPNVSLGYASSDVQGESPLNQLISHCDRIATKVLRLIEEEPPGSESLVTVPGAPYRAGRLWRVETSPAEPQPQVPA